MEIIKQVRKKPTAQFIRFQLVGKFRAVKARVHVIYVYFCFSRRGDKVTVSQSGANYLLWAVAVIEAVTN